MMLMLLMMTDDVVCFETMLDSVGDEDILVRLERPICRQDRQQAGLTTD